MIEKEKENAKKKISEEKSKRYNVVGDKKVRYGILPEILIIVNFIVNYPNLKNIPFINDLQMMTVLYYWYIKTATKNLKIS